jgi:hypothetical protein
MTKDFADFLASLKREGVVHVVIGGMAGKPEKDLPDLARLEKLRRSTP